MNIAATLGAAKQALTSKAGLAMLAGQKHAPTILFGAGVVGVVGTVVLASKATLHLGDVLDEFEDKKEMSKDLRAEKPEKYTEKQFKQDQTVLHTRLVIDVTKLYLPAVGLGVVSLAALGGSHVLLTRRNAALTATLAAVDKAFKEYRGRVKEELGEDKDREFMYGTSTREELVETKKGGTKVEKITTFGDGSSPYSKVFDADNFNFQNTIEGNGWFIRLIQNHCNDRLQAKGHLLLNDVYRELGMDDTEAGCVTGWLRDGEGDGYIDFGCWKDEERGGLNPFHVGADGAILLDFNVDGPIFKALGNSGN